MIGVQPAKPLQHGWEMPRLRPHIEGLNAVFRGVLRAGSRWLRSAKIAMRARSGRRSLRVAESVSLGDKRAVYLIEVEGQRLLLGASAAGVTLLSQLPPQKEAWQSAVKELVFADVMESCESAQPAKSRAATRRATGETR